MFCFFLVLLHRKGYTSKCKSENTDQTIDFYAESLKVFTKKKRPLYGSGCKISVIFKSAKVISGLEWKLGVKEAASGCERMTHRYQVVSSLSDPYQVAPSSGARSVWLIAPEIMVQLILNETRCSGINTAFIQNRTEQAWVLTMKHRALSNLNHTEVRHAESCFPVFM